MLGSSDLDRHHILRWGPRAWSVQFHPEMRAVETRLSVAWRSERLLAEGRDPAGVVAREVDGHPVFGELLLVGQQVAGVRLVDGTELSCRGWQQEAALRMFHNNLDPDNAENPDELVVYGGTGRAARSWASS
mgnify:CR=1 FL=1